MSNGQVTTPRTAPAKRRLTPCERNGHDYELGPDVYEKRSGPGKALAAERRYRKSFCRRCPAEIERVVVDHRAAQDGDGQP